MEKARRFFRNLSEKRSYQIVVFAVSMCLILGIYVGLRIVISEDVAQRYTITEDRNLIKNIEKVYIEGDVLTISGWCFYKNVDSTKDKVQVFLRNIKNEEETIWLKVEDIVREDINDYYDCEYDYSHVGFDAKVKIKNLNLQENDYEIFLKLTYVKELINQTEGGVEIEEKEYKKTVSTKQYISKGEPTVFKPEEGVEPIRTASEKLNEVFDRGQLLVQNEDMDIYVYQYGDKIFWVAGEKYYFEEDGTTKVQFQLDTTRPDLLPENRVNKGLTTDNIGFNFEENELQGDESFPYRVAWCNIPGAYPITYFWTGYYTDSKWIWRENLNIDVRNIR